MSVTQANALVAIRARLGETSSTNSAWTDVELRGWLNEAVRDIARRTESVQNTTDVAFSAGTQEVTLAANILRVHAAEWKEGTFDPATGDTAIYPLEYRDFHTMDAVWWTQQAVTSSTPALFTLWGYPPALKLVLYPKPYVAGEVRLHYYEVPTDLATDGTAASTALTIPEGWIDLAYEYVTYLALRRDRDPRWREAKEEYVEKMEDMLVQTRRWSDQGGVITPQGSFLPAWLVDGYE